MIRRPWTSQPQRRVSLRRGHSLARGVISAIGWNLDQLGRAVLLDAGLTPFPSARGLLIGGFNNALKADTNTPILTAPPFTIAFDVVRISTALSNPESVSQGGSGSGGGGWAVTITGGFSTSPFRLTFGGVADYSNSTGVLNVGELYRITVVVSGNSGTARYYINGVFDSSRSVGNMRTNSSRPLTIGAAHNNTNYLNFARGGGWGNVTYWNRALSDNEVLSEYINPFQIFEPEPLQIYWPEASAGGATTHDTTGALSGAGSSIVGSAAHVALHTTSGALAGAGATVAGSAARTRAHATSGVLAGSGAAIVGSAAHIAVHVTSGVLAGAGASITGSADRSLSAGEHPATGALVGAGSSIVGSAARTAVHVTSGALAGSGAVVAGAAARQVTHATSGVLVGAGSAISGVAANGTEAQPDAFIGGGGWGVTHSQAQRLLDRLKKKDAKNWMPTRSSLSSICWTPCRKKSRPTRLSLRCSSSRMGRGVKLMTAYLSASPRLSSESFESTKRISVN